MQCKLFVGLTFVYYIVCRFVYLFDNKNKLEYQKMVRTFYETNTYKFEEFKKSELTDCYKKYKILGKYKWNK